MRVGIFYLSMTPAAGRRPIQLPEGGRAYIRVEEVTSDSLSDALDQANPQSDENVMNSHELAPWNRD